MSPAHAHIAIVTPVPSTFAHCAEPPIVPGSTSWRVPTVPPPSCPPAEPKNESSWACAPPPPKALPVPPHAMATLPLAVVSSYITANGSSRPALRMPSFMVVARDWSLDLRSTPIRSGELKEILTAGGAALVAPVMAPVLELAVVAVFVLSLLASTPIRTRPPHRTTTTRTMIPMISGAFDFFLIGGGAP